jgi:hypothetical protein
MVRWFSMSNSAANNLDERLKLPAHAIYTTWQWPQRLREVEFDITIHNDPGTAIGEYLSPFNGDIDGAQIYFGIQTDVFKPSRPDPGWGTGDTIGKGLIFSTWWSFDAADTRVADDGYIQLGTHEGRFVGVRRPYEWTVGHYRVRLARGEAGGDGDWFDLSIQSIGAAVPSGRPEPTGAQHWIGALRFKRADPKIPATISARGSAFLEVYSRAKTFRDIAAWSVDMQAYGDGERPSHASGSYPRYPNEQNVPNADTWYDSDRDRIHLSFGGETLREHMIEGSRAFY